MTKFAIAMLAIFAAVSSAQAHQIWIEQDGGQNAVVRFGEFGENLREASPGLLDKFGKVTATLLSARGEQKAEAAKMANGFTLPFAANAEATIIAEDASYPLYTIKVQRKDSVGWYYPAARLITDFAAREAKLPLDLVPTGEAGQFKLVFKGQPKPKTKVTLVTQSGWSKEANTDDQGLVNFDMPWRGTYVAEVNFTDRTGGERGSETYDGVSYATTLTYFNANGLDPLPAPPPATPAK